MGNVAIFKMFLTFFLMLGLLKFAVDAPGIFKNIIGSVDDALKGKFNGFSSFSDIGKDLKKTGDAAKKLGQGVGKAVSAPIKAGYAAGKGVYKGGGAIGGGVSGAIAGGKQGGFMGAMRGLVAGGKQGFQTPGHAVAYGGFTGDQAGQMSKKQKEAFASSRNRFNDSYKKLMDANKNSSEIEKLKADKTALEAQYKENVNDRKKQLVDDYKSDATKAAAAVTAGKRQRKDDYINNRRKELAKAYGFTDDAPGTPGGKTAVQKLTDAALAGSGDPRQAEIQSKLVDANNKGITLANAMSNDEAMVYKAEQEAKAMYESSFKTKKSELERKIGELEGEALNDNERAISNTVKEFIKEKEKWSNNTQNSFNNNFNAKMHNPNANKELTDIVNQTLNASLGTTGEVYAGKDASKNLTEKQIADLSDSIAELADKTSRTVAEEEELKNKKTTMAFILGAMKKANDDTNRSISTSGEIYSTLIPQQQKKDKK